MTRRGGNATGTSSKSARPSSVRQIIKKRRYYQDSYHLAFEYVGQRNDVATIYGRPEAQAVLARMKSVDEVMTAHANRGDGTPLRPQQEWVEQPGAIPETADR